MDEIYAERRPSDTSYHADSPARSRTRRRSAPAASSCATKYLQRQVRRVRPSTARGIHHAAFVCKDVEETIRFYQDFLGFPLVELVENRDYAGSSHFFFDLGNRNLLGFFDFPGHDHQPYEETIGALQHMADLGVRPSSSRRAKAKLDDARSTTSARTAAPTTACTSATRTGLGIELYHEELGVFEGTRLLADG